MAQNWTVIIISRVQLHIGTDFSPYAIKYLCLSEHKSKPPFCVGFFQKFKANIFDTSKGWSFKSRRVKNPSRYAVGPLIDDILNEEDLDEFETDDDS